MRSLFLKESYSLLGWWWGKYYLMFLEPLYKTEFLRCRKTWSNIPSTMALIKFLTDVV